MKTLIINAHPDYQNETTFSAKLQHLELEHD
jgi:FMN-dependent NADH-azoreductase